VPSATASPERKTRSRRSGLSRMCQSPVSMGRRTRPPAGRSARTSPYSPPSSIRHDPVLCRPPSHPPCNWSFAVDFPTDVSWRFSGEKLGCANRPSAWCTEISTPSFSRKWQIAAGTRFAMTGLVVQLAAAVIHGIHVVIGDAFASAVVECALDRAGCVARCLGLALVARRRAAAASPAHSAGYNSHLVIRAPPDPSYTSDHWNPSFSAFEPGVGSAFRAAAGFGPASSSARLPVAGPIPGRPAPAPHSCANPRIAATRWSRHYRWPSPFQRSRLHCHAVMPTAAGGRADPAASRRPPAFAGGLHRDRGPNGPSVQARSLTHTLPDVAAVTFSSRIPASNSHGTIEACRRRDPVFGRVPYFHARVCRARPAVCAIAADGGVASPSPTFPARRRRPRTLGWCRTMTKELLRPFRERDSVIGFRPAAAKSIFRPRGLRRDSRSLAGFRRRAGQPSRSTQYQQGSLEQYTADILLGEPVPGARARARGKKLECTHPSFHRPTPEVSATAAVPDAHVIA